jgi:hypothetical protein
MNLPFFSSALCKKLVQAFTHLAKKNPFLFVEVLCIVSGSPAAILEHCQQVPEKLS